MTLASTTPDSHRPIVREEKKSGGRQYINPTCAQRLSVGTVNEMYEFPF